MRPALAAILALPFFALPSVAHHGWGSYDANTPVTLTATVEEITLGNPHGMLMLTQDGTMWHVTLAPLSRMTARGATGDIVKAGTEVKAFGYPKRDGTKEIRAEWIEIGGKRFELR
ncbi:DUF6152 family protein [Aestuariivirga sp.]|uniref:DUF6152 family protein n=1 Tax=Aestuariivirga sp. TaxID=2650926 RepID=UPI003593DD58